MVNIIEFVQVMVNAHGLGDRGQSRIVHICESNLESIRPCCFLAPVMQKSESLRTRINYLQYRR